MNCLKIYLTQGKVALVDDEDFLRINQFKWHARWHEQTQSYYAQRMTSRKLGKQRSIQMHREVLGASVGVQVDHINCDTLDNRRSNLRLATNAQNVMNSGVRCDNKSGFKGVTKDRDRWSARITLSGKTMRLGSFRTPEEAHAAYCAAAKALHGEFARTA